MIRESCVLLSLSFSFPLLVSFFNMCRRTRGNWKGEVDAAAAVAAVRKLRAGDSVKISWRSFAREEGESCSFLISLYFFFVFFFVFFFLFSSFCLNKLGRD